MVADETVHVFRENISLECVNFVLVAVLGGGGGGRREGKGEEAAAVLAQLLHLLLVLGLQPN